MRDILIIVLLCLGMVLYMGLGQNDKKTQIMPSASVNTPTPPPLPVKPLEINETALDTSSEAELLLSGAEQKKEEEFYQLVKEVERENHLVKDEGTSEPDLKEGNPYVEQPAD